MTTYEDVADGLEFILAAKKPRMDMSGNVNVRVALPPVALFEGEFIGNPDGFFPPEDVTPDLLENVNVAFLLKKEHEGQPVHVLKWLRTPTIQERRRCMVHAKHMITLTGANFWGSHWTGYGTDILGWIGGKWRDVRKQGMVPDGNHLTGIWSAGTSLDMEVKMLMSVALNMRYEYSAVLSDDPNNLSARIYADPRTLRFMLRTRELGNAERRRALIHMVKAHARRRKRSHKVAGHLRGEHHCRWAGMDVKVLPSQFDAEKLKPGAVVQRLRDENLARHVPV